MSNAFDLSGRMCVLTQPRGSLRLPGAGDRLGFQPAFLFGPNDDKQSSLQIAEEPQNRIFS